MATSSGVRGPERPARLPCFPATTGTRNGVCRGTHPQFRFHAPGGLSARIGGARISPQGPLAAALERAFEGTPGLRRFAAHNVILATK